MSTEAIKYEVAEDADFAGEWRVEGFGSDGECYVAIFSGPKAEHRAKNYAAWLNMTDEQPTREAMSIALRGINHSSPTASRKAVAIAIDAHTQALRTRLAACEEALRLGVKQLEEATSALHMNRAAYPKVHAAMDVMNAALKEPSRG